MSGGLIAKQAITNLGDGIEDISLVHNPTVLLENFDGLNSVFTTSDAFNLAGTSHTVKITVGGVTGVCSERPPDTADGDDGNTCTSDADCADSDDFCDFSGYHVGIAITGQNPQDIGFVTTGPDGSVQITYADTNGAGQDVIQACLDLGEDGVVPDDFNTLPITQCIAEQEPGDDIASNIVNKFWLANFVTGGGKVSGPGGSFWTFGGIVGPNPAGPGIVGEWQEVVHKNGQTRSCHWNSFTSLLFSGPPTASPPSTHNTATFITGPGVCNDGTTPIITVTEVDNHDGGKGADTLNVGGTSPGNISTGGTKKLSGGNVQVHNT